MSDGAGSPAWLDRLLAELDKSDLRATTLARGMSAEQLNWKPTPYEWSVGQCLDHLCEANEVYVKPMAAALEGKPEGHAATITPGWFGRWFIRAYIEPSAVTRRGRAPKKIAPASQVPASVLDRFLQTNEQARAFVRRAARYDVNRLRFRNPFVRGIRFTVGTGLEILVRHQWRHLLQAERVKERMR